MDALIVREAGTAVELFDLGVFENRDTVLVSSGHGGSLFLRGHGTHLFVHHADADSEAARHVFDANFGVVNGIRGRTIHQRRESTRPLPPHNRGFRTSATSSRSVRLLKDPGFDTN